MVKLTHDNTQDGWRAKVKHCAGTYAVNEHKPVRNTLDEWFTPYAFPGGYPIVYTNDSGDVLCAECAAKDFLTGVDITTDCYYEGPSIYCDECNTEIESAYGDPEDQDEE